MQLPAQLRVAESLDLVIPSAFWSLISTISVSGRPPTMSSEPASKAQKLLETDFSGLIHFTF
jgi:hypothetical protein